MTANEKNNLLIVAGMVSVVILDQLAAVILLIKSGTYPGASALAQLAVGGLLAHLRHPDKKEGTNGTNESTESSETVSG